ncbi:hypothetical protein H0E87_017188 [Populus deltoides]|uniref:Proline-rich protein n=1 Tax=Populus deltoides TaxID=3696 RepID=A0A8T2XZD2_POPDE|nr:hypothetical protein H0E87_017188 [Populus deltoides]
MRILPVFRGALLCFYVSLVFAAAFCYADDSTAEVVGIGECADCAQSNIKTVHAFSGLKVTIDCKPENGEFKTRGVGELDEEGKFKVSLPNDVVKDGKLKEECYAQLHSASAAPCPAHNGLESSKIVFKSKTDEKHTFGLAGKLKFSPVTCTSAFLWPHPPITKPLPLPTWKLPPLKNFHHPYLFPPKVFPPFPPKVFPPIHKKPLLPHVPIYKPKPKPPMFKPPPVPIYKPKPKPPIFKPLPPPIPIYKPKPKPPIFKPPPVPIYKPKPKPPIFKPLPPPIPTHKPLPPPVPIYKPLPPIPKIPPFHKKPCPPLPKLPPYPKIPPKYFHHPKFGKWPPLPPHSPIH